MYQTAKKKKKITMILNNKLQIENCSENTCISEIIDDYILRTANKMKENIMSLFHTFYCEVLTN